MATGAAPADKPATDAPPHTLRGFLAALFEALRTRLELAAVELEIHLLLLVRTLLLAVGAVACALLALAFGLTALVVVFWNTHRLLALIGGSLVFVALAGLFAWLAARTLRQQPGALAGSLRQLHEDEQHLGGTR